MYGLQSSHDPHATYVADLITERDAARAEATKLRRQLRRANIGAGIILVIWVASFAYNLAKISGV